MDNEEINDITSSVVTATEEISLETSMCLVENIEHVGLATKHSQDTSHSTSQYGMHDSEDLKENLNSIEKIFGSWK